jgi:transcriptional regulator with XRE-family HTH domain
MEEQKENIQAMTRRVRWAVPPEVSQEEPVTPDTPIEVVRQMFARRLWGLMVQKGMNQSELSRAAGIARDSVSTYVRALAMPDPVNTAKMAQALGVSISDLHPTGAASGSHESVPAIEVKQAIGNPGRAWLRCNVEVPFDVAVQVMALLSSASKTA